MVLNRLEKLQLFHLHNNFICESGIPLTDAAVAAHMQKLWTKTWFGSSPNLPITSELLQQPGLSEMSP